LGKSGKTLEEGKEDAKEALDKAHSGKKGDSRKSSHVGRADRGPRSEWRSRAVSSSLDRSRQEQLGAHDAKVDILNDKLGKAEEKIKKLQEQIDDDAADKAHQAQIALQQAQRNAQIRQMINSFQVTVGRFRSIRGWIAVILLALALVLFTVFLGLDFINNLDLCVNTLVPQEECVCDEYSCDCKLIGYTRAGNCVDLVLGWPQLIGCSVWAVLFYFFIQEWLTCNPTRSFRFVRQIAKQDLDERFDALSAKDITHMEPFLFEVVSEWQERRKLKKSITMFVSAELIAQLLPPANTDFSLADSVVWERMGQTVRSIQTVNFSRWYSIDERYNVAQDSRIVAFALYRHQKLAREEAGLYFQEKPAF
jgi:hypothetical protein